MKGFIQRLALLIHWIGFVVIVGGVVVGLGGVLYQSILEFAPINPDGSLESDNELFERIVAYGSPSFGEVLLNYLVIGALGVGIGLFLWVLKWLISGNKSFFPWRS